MTQFWLHLKLIHFITVLFLPCFQTIFPGAGCRSTCLFFPKLWLDSFLVVWEVCSIVIFIWEMFTFWEYQTVIQKLHSIFKLCQQLLSWNFHSIFDVMRKTPLHFQSTLLVVFESFWIGFADAQSKVSKITLQSYVNFYSSVLVSTRTAEGRYPEGGRCPDPKAWGWFNSYS